MSGSTNESSETDFRSMDGLRLRGTVVVPREECMGAAVLVHGGGVTRDEGGFFARLAGGLAAGGIASLRFDLRGHGGSDGRQEDLTLGGIVNDVRAAVDHLGRLTDRRPTNLIGASFSARPRRVRDMSRFGNPGGKVAGLAGE